MDHSEQVPNPQWSSYLQNRRGFFLSKSVARKKKTFKTLLHSMQACEPGFSLSPPRDLLGQGHRALRSYPLPCTPVLHVCCQGLCKVTVTSAYLPNRLRTSQRLLWCHCNSCPSPAGLMSCPWSSPLDIWATPPVSSRSPHSFTVDSRNKQATQ